MKKIFIVTCFLMLMAATATAFAASGDLMRTPGSFVSATAVQTFAPDGTAVSTLSVNSTTIDLSKFLLYSIYSASGTCFQRLMPLATSTKASYTAVPIPNTTWHMRAVNVNTKFANMSGCVGGFVQKQ